MPETIISADDPAFTTIQDAFDAAEGKTIVFNGNRVYDVNTTRIKSRTRVITNGCLFKHVGPTNSVGLSVDGTDVIVDQLRLEIPSGEVVNGILISSNRFVCDHLSVVSPSDVAHDRSRQDFGIRIENCEDVSLGRVICNNIRYALVVAESSRVRIQQALITTCFRGVWFENSHDCEFGTCRVKDRHPETGDEDGHNALLVGGDSSQLVFYNWHISDCGEHGVRIATGSHISLVRFNIHNCGGSGIKVAEANQTGSILIDAPVIWNVATEGGHGSGIRLENCANVTLRNPVVYKVDPAPYSAIFGVYLKNVHACDIIYPRIVDLFHSTGAISDQGGNSNIRTLG